MAELFARNGMRVAINYHGNAQRAEDLVAKLKSVSSLAPKEGRVDYRAIKADLAVRADVERLVKETVSAMCPDPSTQQLDVVFSNGGWTRMTNLMDLEEAMVDEDWDRCFTMNVKSHLWLLYAAKPYLEAAYSEKEGAASFITTASLAGVKVSGSSLAYSVTKAAQLHLAKGLAMISAPKIRVNSVSPGLLLTVSPSVGHAYSPVFIQMIRNEKSADTVTIRSGDANFRPSGYRRCRRLQNSRG